MPRALGICGRGARVDARAFALDGYEVRAGFFDVAEPAFDPDEQPESVLVEVLAFSCNFRDRSLVLRMATAPLPDRFYAVGSELAGRVLAVGSAVRTLHTGDRVLLDNAYGDGAEPWGVPTNHASRSLHVLPASRLARVPDGMDDATAAAFALGAQTAFAMVRRARLGPGTRALVTAGSSNTSLFLLAAARYAGAEVWLATTSPRHVERLLALGAAGVVDVEPTTRLCEAVGLRDAAPFDAALDPFADLYLERALEVLALGGRYVTCGVSAQFPRPGEERSTRAPRPVLHDTRLVLALTRNVELVANCLGTHADLDAALTAWRSGALPVTLDSVLDGDAVDFLARSFCAPDRFGKVVYRYA